MDLVFKQIYRFITFLGIEILLSSVYLCLFKFMSANIWQATKVGTKLLAGLVIFSIFSSDIPLDFHDSIRLVPL